MSQSTHEVVANAVAKAERTDPATSQPVRIHTGVDHETTTTDKTTTTDGNYVDVKTTTDTHETTSDAFDQRVLNLIKAEDDKRQKLEDVRANKRNLNRMYTLLGAILIGFIIVWTLPRLGHIGAILSPYSFVITVLCDAAVTAWALIKKY